MSAETTGGDSLHSVWSDKEHSNHYRPPRVHRQTLVEMNAAVFTARRNAAYKRVVEIMLHEIRDKSKKERRKLYLLCGMLLNEAIMCTRRSQLQSDSPVMHFLELLKDTINAQEALLRHELKLNQESRELSGMLNQYVVNQMQTGNAEHSEGEKNMLDCIEDLFNFGDPILAQDTNERRSGFRDEDSDRYDLATNEYSVYYGRFNLEASIKELSACKV